MAVWSIKIVPGEHPEDPATFEPQLQPGVSDALLVEAGDAVTWNNTTTDTHQPWPCDPGPTQGIPWDDSKVLPRASAFYLSDPIDPDDSSRPTWIVPSPPDDPAPDEGLILHYCCLLHPTEQATIIRPKPAKS